MPTDVMPVDAPDTYARGLLDLLGDRDPLQTLEQTVPALREVFGRTPAEAVRRPEREGKWSMLEVLHHLADGELVVGFRVRMIVAHDRPPIAAYEQDLWAQRLRYREAEVEPVLDQLACLRAANLRLARRLTDEELARYGVHAERGAESAGYTLRLLAGHDLFHIAQLERIRRAVL